MYICIRESRNWFVCYYYTLWIFLYVSRISDAARVTTREP